MDEDCSCKHRSRYWNCCRAVRTSCHRCWTAAPVFSDWVLGTCELHYGPQNLGQKQYIGYTKNRNTMDSDSHVDMPNSRHSLHQLCTSLMVSVRFPQALHQNPFFQLTLEEGIFH